MNFIFLSHHYNRYGCSNVFSPIGDIMELHLNHYGEAISSIEIEAYLRSSTYNPTPTLENLFTKYHKNLEQLPKITFYRKLRRLNIKYLCRVRSAEEDEGNEFSLKATNTAMLELIDVLQLIGKRLKKSDDFDFSRFIVEANQILKNGFATEAEIRDSRIQVKDRRLAEQATKDPWELLEIDWSRFHPEARNVLNDTFFWSCSDDFSPHGNDTGADLLADYQKWVKRNPNASPLKFLDRLFQSWGILPIDWNVTDEKEVQHLSEMKGIELTVSNKAIIALAFATLKVKGKCPKDISDLALKAIQRDSFSFMEEGMEEKNRLLHREAIAKMRTKLIL